MTQRDPPLQLPLVQQGCPVAPQATQVPLEQMPPVLQNPLQHGSPTAPQCDGPHVPLSQTDPLLQLPPGQHGSLSPPQLTHTATLQYCPAGQAGLHPPPPEVKTHPPELSQVSPLAQQTPVLQQKFPVEHIAPGQHGWRSLPHAVQEPPRQMWPVEQSLSLQHCWHAPLQQMSLPLPQVLRFWVVSAWQVPLTHVWQVGQSAFVQHWSQLPPQHTPLLPLPVVQVVPSGR